MGCSYELLGFSIFQRFIIRVHEGVFRVWSLGGGGVLEIRDAYPYRTDATKSRPTFLCEPPMPLMHSGLGCMP